MTDLQKPRWTTRLREGAAKGLLLLGGAALLGGFLGVCFAGPGLLWAASFFAGLGGLGGIIAGHCVMPGARAETPAAPPPAPEAPAGASALGSLQACGAFNDHGVHRGVKGDTPSARSAPSNRLGF